jgi:hypothetical protein
MLETSTGDGRRDWVQRGSWVARLEGSWFLVRGWRVVVMINALSRPTRDGGEFRELLNAGIQRAKRAPGTRN